MSAHALRQLKLIVPGALVTYRLSVIREFTHVWNDGPRNLSILASLSLGLGLATISLFLYILLLPFLKGEQPNYKQWRQSGTLSTVIPILTSTIVLGWIALTVTLSSSLGVIQGIIGAMGMYALCFGLVGLIPVSRRGRR